MKYRRLGKTNLRVSVIGIGTWQLGGEWGKTFEQPEVDAMFDACRNQGINLIDTAECYGDHTSEQFIGNAIARDRDKWIVATKFGHKFHGHMNRTDERSPAEAQTQVEASLKALRTDFIDILQYHSVRDEEFDNDALSDVLFDLLKSGKIRFIGNSIGKSANAVFQTEASARRNVETIQVIYNRLDRVPEERIFPACVAQDLGILARVPLASGLLSGKYQAGTKFSATEFRGTMDQKIIDDRLREVEKIRQDEIAHGVEMAQWALAWCLRHPAVSTVIPGCKDVNQVHSNAAAANLADDNHPQAWK
jgi:aryl-alcohol dehydrogenase-like predicted oxidoreductase